MGAEHVLKPYPNEHAARVREPDKFEKDSFRRKNIADGVDIITGRLRGETTMSVQAYRFAKEKFSADQAKAWLKSHDVKSAEFEAATSKADDEWEYSGSGGLVELLFGEDLDDETLMRSLFEKDHVAKMAGFWSSAAGKRRHAKRLVEALPEHKCYCEPFAGSGAVFWAKEPSEREVLNDGDQSIMDAYKFVKSCTDAEIAALKKMKWFVRDKSAFERLKNSKPSGRVEKFHRFLLLKLSSFFGNMANYNEARVKPRQETFDSPLTIRRLEQGRERLKGVELHCGDYKKAVATCDGAGTILFMDPPYAGFDQGVGEKQWDEHDYAGWLKTLKSKFCITYGIRGDMSIWKADGWRVQRWKFTRPWSGAAGRGHVDTDIMLVITNYNGTKKGDRDTLPVPERAAEIMQRGVHAAAKVQQALAKMAKAFNAVDIVDENTVPDLVEKRQPFGTFGGSFKYAKKLVPLIPEHKVYCEPFAGAAAVLHAMEKREGVKEILSDVDDDVVFLHRYCQGIDEARVEKLAKKYDWNMTKAGWERLVGFEPSDDDGRFWKLVMRRTHGRDARPDATHLAGNGESTTNPKKYLSAAERLKGVKIVQQDYRKTLKQFDGPDTFFFLDPPYPGEWFDKKMAVDLEEFVAAVQKVKGKYIAVINDSEKNREAFKKLGKMFRINVVEASGTGGSKKADRLFASNFDVKALGDGASAEHPADLTDILQAGVGLHAFGKAAGIGEDVLGPLADGIADLSEVLWANKNDVQALAAGLTKTVGLVPDGKMTTDERRESQVVRSRKYEIEALDGAGERLTFAPGYPTDLDQYGDPANLLYPVDSVEQAKNARVLFKQSADVYSQDDSRRMVHKRIVEAELRLGVKPAFDPEDPLDKLLPAEVTDRLTKGSGDDLDVLKMDVEILKAGSDDERYVLGFVLRKDTVDKQKDIYDAKAIRGAMTTFMVNGHTQGIFHREAAGKRTLLIENYQAPADFTISKGETSRGTDVQVKAGDWLQGWLIPDDGLWAAVKAGKLTGFSIGGWAKRTPEKAA